MLNNITEAQLKGKNALPLCEARFLRQYHETLVIHFPEKIGSANELLRIYELTLI